MRNLLLIICSLLFIGCSYKYEGKQYTKFDFVRMHYVTSGINVDVNTDVLYWYGGGSSPCPIFKADGTCLTLTEWQNQKSKAREERITKLGKGDIVYVADTLKRLKGFVDTNLVKDVKVVDDISSESNEDRIGVIDMGGKILFFNLAYLICPSYNAEAYKAWHEGNKIEIEYAELDENETSVWRLFENEDPNWCKFHYRPAPKEITKSVHQLVDNTKEYRPFNSIDELTAEFVKRFRTKTPSYALPLIWVKPSTKGNNERYLITGYIDNEENGQLVKIGDKYYGLCVLFAAFKFLDGSTCGVEK